MHHRADLERINFSLAADWDLNAAEVTVRQAKYGWNDIIEKTTNRYWELLSDTAKDPMIWFLLITSGLFFLLHNYREALTLLIATIPLIGMDAFLHWRTKISTQALSSKLTTQALVIRNHQQISIPARELVPGDLVIVAAGQSFPADGLIIAGKNLQVDESTLTGESLPAAKLSLSTAPDPSQQPAIAGTHWGFAGTRLLTGQALLRVIYTGRETLYGEIIHSALATSHARTPLQRAVSKLIFVLILVASTFCLILASVRLYQGFGLIDAILSAATLAVAALPDEFPVVFTIFLVVGVYRLAQRKALVKRAICVENIGRVNCICSDKTGTMTLGHFQLTAIIPHPQLNETELLTIAAISSRLETGDALDLAIFEAAKAQQIQAPERLKTFAFTEERKQETSVVQLNSQEILIATKGAPENILRRCTLSAAELANWRQQLSKLASSGAKVIACAKQVLPSQDLNREPESAYQFCGLLAFADPIRPAVFSAVKICQANNIHVLMITGDHPATARTIAQQIGLGNGKEPRVLLGDEIDQYLAQNGAQFFHHVDVIARAIPAQKLKIVRALQEAQEIVAVTGDGVNDVPALKASDIGIAMGERGTQSAREVSDIILLDDNFNSIVQAISEGRQLFKNLQLSYKYVLIVHMPFVIAAAVIPLLGLPLVYYPIHIVLIELIIHPTCMLVFHDLPQPDALQNFSSQNQAQIFQVKDWLKIIGIGLFPTIVVISSFIFYAQTDLEYARTLVIAELCATSAALTIGLSKLKTFLAKIITAGTLIFPAVLIQISWLGKFISLTPLRFSSWIFVGLTGLLTFLLTKI